MSDDSTYKIEVAFTVHPHTDEHLQTPQRIKDELQSWLKGLHATVHSVIVRSVGQDEE